MPDANRVTTVTGVLRFSLTVSDRARDVAPIARAAEPSVHEPYVAEIGSP